MSYDVTFCADLGADELVPLEGGDRNYTSNVSGMWRKALGGVSLGDLLDPDPVAETLVDPLNKAIAEMMESPAIFREMNPPNGWGDYDSLLKVLRDMRDAVPEWPTVWRCHG